MTKKTLLSIAISSIVLTACGGGGGGQNTPNTGSTNTTQHMQQNNNTENQVQNNTKNEQKETPVEVKKPEVVKDKPQKNVKSTSDYIEHAKQDKSDAMSGVGATVMLVDTGVDTTKKTLQDKNISKKMLRVERNTVSNTNTEETTDKTSHGSNMAETITQTAPKATVEVVGFNGASIQKIIVSSADYEKTNKADIINNSYTNNNGSQRDLDSLKHLAIPAVKDMIEHGALYLVATGNQGNNEPNSTAKMPKLESELVSGFLAVGGVRPDGVSLYNKCGEAAEYCVTANAYHKNTNKDGQEFLNGGTSSSTAYVSGVASRIKSRYDFMTGKELKDVLITTATDAGDTGVDPVFGQGIVNPDKALNGYGRFDKTVHLNVDGKKDTYYFDNNITGNGGLVKDGKDTLVLNGNNTYTGGNVVNNGKLVLNGQNVSSVEVKESGKLAVGDSLTVSSGSVLNNGTLVSNTITDYQINGDLNSGKKSTIEKAIGSKINVTGVANLDGTLKLTGVASGYVTADGEKETLLSANKINGSFNTVNKNAVSDLIEQNINIDDKNVTVSTTRKDVGLVAVTQSDYVGKDVAVSNVNKLLKEYDKKHQNGQLSDDSMSAKLASEVVYSNNLTKTLFDLGTETHKHAIENQSLNEVAQNERFIKHLGTDNVWVDYNHNESKLSLNGLSGKSHDNGYGVGVNKNINNHNFIFGMNTIHNNWNETFNQTGKSVDLDGYGVDLGYGYDLNGYKLYGLLGYNWLKAKQQYNTDKLKQYTVGFGANKTFSITDKFSITPNVLFQYVQSNSDHLKSSQYTSLNNFKNKRVVGTISNQMQYLITDKISLLGNIDVEHDVHNKTSYVADYAGTGFVNNSNHIGKTRYNAGLGLAVTPIENMSISATVNHKQSSHWKNNSVNMSLNYQF